MNGKTNYQRKSAKYANYTPNTTTRRPSNFPTSFSIFKLSLDGSGGSGFCEGSLGSLNKKRIGLDFIPEARFKELQQISLDGTGGSGTCQGRSEHSHDKYNTNLSTINNKLLELCF